MRVRLLPCSSPHIPWCALRLPRRLDRRHEPTPDDDEEVALKVPSRHQFDRCLLGTNRARLSRTRVPVTANSAGFAALCGEQQHMLAKLGRALG